MSVHRKNLALRYMWIAWLNITRWTALLALVCLLGAALVTREPAWLLPGGISAGIFLLSLVIFFMEASSVRCLGCRASLLLTSRCSKHKSAKKLLGSYRLHPTLSLAIHAPIHCPYCGMRYRIGRSPGRLDRREAEANAESRNESFS